MSSPRSPSFSLLHIIAVWIGLACSMHSLATGQSEGRGSAKEYPVPADAEEAIAWYERDLQNSRRWKYRVRDLGRFPDRSVTELLLKLAHGADARSFSRRKEVLEALGAHPRGEVVAALLRDELLVDDAPYWVRQAAARGLAVHDSAALIVVLRTDFPVRRIAKGVRDKLPPGEFDRIRAIREACVVGLGHVLHNDDAAREEFAHWLAKSPEGDERRTAISALVDVPADVARPLRAAAAEDPRADVAAQAVLQLVRADGSAVIETLLTLHGRLRRDVRAEGDAFADLLRAMRELSDDPRVHGPLLEAAAARRDGAVERVLTALAAEIDRHPGLREHVRGEGLTHPEADVRRVAVRLFAGSNEAGDEVGRLLDLLERERDADVRTVVVEALAHCGDRAAVPPLSTLVDGSGSPESLAAIRAVDRLAGASADGGWLEELRGLTEGSSTSAATRALALDCLATRGAESALPAAHAALGAKPWSVRAAAIDFCTRVRSPRSIDPLIDRVERESGRLREDVLAALRALTARSFPDGKGWRKWWKQREATFELPPAAATNGTPNGATAGKTLTYYDLPLFSEAVCFVVDTSGSMRERLDRTTAGERTRTRLDEAKDQLRTVIEGMAKQTVFNVIFFDEQIRPVFDGLESASKSRRKKALRAVDDVDARRETDVHGALLEAFSDPDVDTIYLLSDGFPSAGEIQDADALADEIVRWNRSRRIRIHCIALGKDSPLLQRVAAESTGVYARR